MNGVALEPLEAGDASADFERASDALQSADAVARQGGEAYLLQLRAPGLEQAHASIQTCRNILECSASPAAQFHAALTLRDVLMREWDQLPAADLAHLRDEIMASSLSQVATPGRPSSQLFVRAQLLQLLALMYKKVWLSPDGATAVEGLRSRVGQLLGDMGELQCAGLQLLLAVLSEFSFTRLTAVGMTWEFHIAARHAFQQSQLLDYFRYAVDWLGRWAQAGGALQQADATAAALGVAAAALR